MPFESLVGEQTHSQCQECVYICGRYELFFFLEVSGISEFVTMGGMFLFTSSAVFSTLTLELKTSLFLESGIDENSEFVTDEGDRLCEANLLNIRVSPSSKTSFSVSSLSQSWQTLSFPHSCNLCQHMYRGSNQWLTVHAWILVCYSGLSKVTTFIHITYFSELQFLLSCWNIPQQAQNRTHYVLLF